MKSIPEEIFKAANYYEMTELKNIAEIELIEQLSLPNMLNMFLLADMHNAKDLKLSSKKLIIDNLEELVKDKDWKKKISESHDPELAFEIVDGLAAIGGVKKKQKLQ